MILRVYSLGKLQKLTPLHKKFIPLTCVISVYNKLHKYTLRVTVVP